jgi:hypothetical protein
MIWIPTYLAVSSFSSRAYAVDRFDEFQPFLAEQHKDRPLQEFASFDTAADTFFSQLQSQKLDMQALQQVGGDENDLRWKI